MTTRAVLIAARALIANPKNWRKAPKHSEIKADGAPLCMGYAVQKAAGGDNSPVFIDALAALTPWRGSQSVTMAIVNFNDAPERTHAEVLAAFDKAIAATAP